MANTIKKRVYEDDNNNLYRSPQDVLEESFCESDNGEIEVNVYEFIGKARISEGKPVIRMIK